MASTQTMNDVLPLAPEGTGDPAATQGELSMFDLILRGETHMKGSLGDERGLSAELQKLLTLSLLGLGAHGLVVGFAAEILGASLFEGGDRGHPIVWMPLSFVLAFVGALCVCMPSFYFYTQLSGLDASFRLVTAQALRAQATAAVLLLGVTPFYAAVILAATVGLVERPDTVLFIGAVLPFVVGLFGVRALYKGFCDLAEVLPRTHARRGDFLRRMVLCWACVYTAVAPVALYRLADALRHIL